MAEKRRRMEEDIELERLRLEGLDEEAIAAHERKIEREREWREIEKMEKEAEKEKDDEKMEDARKAGEKQLLKEANEDRKIQAKIEKQKEKDQTESLKTLADFFGKKSSLGQAFLVAWKAQEVSTAVANTYSAANKAWNLHGGWPGGIIPAAATIAKGLANVQQIVAARTGGMVPGNPAYGDAYPHLLQAGETVVPRNDFKTLERGILASAGAAAGASAGELEVTTNLNLGLTADAGKLFQESTDGVEALAI